MIYDLFLLCHHPENRELLPAQRAPLSQSLAVAGFLGACILCICIIYWTSANY